MAIEAASEFMEMYDAAVDVWQDTRAFMTDNALDKGMGNSVSHTGTAKNKCHAHEHAAFLVWHM